MERLIIAVPTCWKYLDRVEGIRATWGPLCAAWGFDLKFFFGRRPGITNAMFHCMPPDAVKLDVDDGYLGLPRKVQLTAEWALTHNYQRMFKTDDDCYVVPELLARRPVWGLDYVGRVRHASGGYPALFTSGFAYWLSVKAMHALASTPLNQDWAEDRWVGNCLALNGIPAWHDNEAYVPAAPTLTPPIIHRCNIKYAAVFCEFQSPKEMAEMHRANLMLPKPLSPTTPCKMAALNTVTSESYFKVPDDKPAARYHV